MTNYGICKVSDKTGWNDRYIIDRIYTYKDKQTARINSNGYYFTRCETINGMSWHYFYNGRQVNIQLENS